MSIYGPEDPDVASAEPPADAATKTYVDAQDGALRAYVDTHTVNKAYVDMQDGVLRDFSRAYVDTHTVNKAYVDTQDGVLRDVLRAYVDATHAATETYVDTQDDALRAYVDTHAATKTYVDGRKEVITIWAELKWTPGCEYAWSFGYGTGTSGYDYSQSGFPIMVSGRILRLGVSAATIVGTFGDVLTVSVVVNGDNTGRSVTKPDGAMSGTSILAPPLELQAGSIINFRSRSVGLEGITSIVSALIELDL